MRKIEFLSPSLLDVPKLPHALTKRLMSIIHYDRYGMLANSTTAIREVKGQFGTEKNFTQSPGTGGTVCNF